jgi:hypothetical protein
MLALYHRRRSSRSAQNDLDLDVHATIGSQACDRRRRPFAGTLPRLRHGIALAFALGD